MDEAEWGEDDEGNLVSRRVIPADFAVLGFGLARDLFAVCSRVFDVAQTLAMQHANFITTQRLFRQEAAIEIETLTSGDADG